MTIPAFLNGKRRRGCIGWNGAGQSGVLRVWARRREVGEAARVRKIWQRGFYANIERAGMLRVRERCGAVGGVGKENLGE